MVDHKPTGERFRADQVPDDLKKEDLTEPRHFNLMFETNIGPVKNEHSAVYLRPETAQGIFVNFENVLRTMRAKLPFGIANIGKSFRNEITPGQFIFRTREFEQMEIEFFCKEEDSQYPNKIKEAPLAALLPPVITAIGTVVLFIYPELFLNFAIFNLKNMIFFNKILIF